MMAITIWHKPRVKSNTQELESVHETEDVSEHDLLCIQHTIVQGKRRLNKNPYLEWRFSGNI